MSMTPRAILESRYDGPIPARERDTARYPTRDHQIERAQARVRAAETQIADRKGVIHLMAVRMRARGMTGTSARLAREMMRTHGPHIQYWARERKRWADHLKDLTELEG